MPQDTIETLLRSLFFTRVVLFPLLGTTIPSNETLAASD
ncbi:hypothetical protein JCM19233_908 [Vibrio astriarenae]|nr:hypothetical protein JCM19233_908 [Vibrio sp. C7]